MENSDDPRLHLPHPVFDAWLSAVNAHSIPQVCDLYAPDAFLLPTLSPTLRGTPEARREYFEVFLSKPNLQAHLDYCYVQQFGDVRIDSGIYTFSWGGSGVEQASKARFTVVIRDEKIVTHHSSMMPS